MYEFKYIFIRKIKKFKNFYSNYLTNDGEIGILKKMENLLSVSN